MNQSAKYKSNIKSPRWKEFTKYALQMLGQKCARCGCTSGIFHVHHLNYDRLGNERLTDVQIVCNECHQRADQERARENESRAQERAYDAALVTYARKKYGENVEIDDAIMEEFYEWQCAKWSDR